MYLLLPRYKSFVFAMKSRKNNLFFIIMIFAFTWVIIGDLVAMHINVICDIDIYNKQPFAKTTKTEKKTYKTKNYKTSGDNQALQLVFTINQNISYDYYAPVNELSYVFFSDLLIINTTDFSKGRSPPVLS